MLALLLAVAAADLYVDPSAANCAAADGSQAAPFCTLAEGLGAAVSGDRLLLAPGDYAAGAVVGIDVEIVGTAGADLTRIVDVPFDVTLLTIEEQAKVTLDGVTFHGGYADDGVGGLDVRGDLVLLRSKVIGNNGGWSGPGSYANLVTGSLAARETLFANNHFMGPGASALFITGDARVLIEDCAFQNNGFGGGVAPSNWAGAVAVGPPVGQPSGNHAQVVLRRTTFERNRCFSLGSFCMAGALGVFAGAGDAPVVRVENCTFSDNFGYGGGAIHVTGQATVTIVASTIASNTTENNGALVASPTSAVTLSHSIVAGNVDWIGLIAGGADLHGAVQSAGYNVVGGIHGGSGPTFVPLASDLVDPSVALGPLGDHGAFGALHPLPLGSTAIDVGSAAPPVASDARGVPRPFGLVDAGAYERGGFGAIELCAAAPNSTGAPSTITTQGSATATENDFRVVVEGLPPQQSAQFLLSRLFTFQPQPGGSVGNLCLGAPIVRIVTSTQTTTQSGQAVLGLDLTQVPTATGAAPVMAGETRWFQLWHRDLQSVPTSNFSPAVEVVFE